MAKYLVKHRIRLHGVVLVKYRIRFNGVIVKCRILIACYLGTGCLHGVVGS
jgi:hypothetical protein